MAAAALVPLVRIPELNTLTGPDLSRKGPFWTSPPVPRHSKAAFLEFLAAATGARIVSSDTFEWVLKALAARAIGLRLPPPPLMIFSVLLAKAVPPRQFLDRVAE